MLEQVLRQIVCEGDPRAMGECQGRALRGSIGELAARAGVAVRGRRPWSLRAFVGGPVLASGMAREIARHYPHLSERIQGIAVGAGLPIDTVMRLFVVAAREGLPGDALTHVALGQASCTQAGTRLLRVLAPGLGAGSQWIARRSVPDVGFASVEFTLPWLASAAAGINEAGVAAMLAPRAVAPTSATQNAIAPSALLLVQECLQRFESLEACIDWSLKRPVSGDISLIVADASGQAAAIEISGTERTVVRADSGLLVAGGPELKHAEVREAEAESNLAPAEPESWQLSISPQDRTLEAQRADGTERLTLRPRILGAGEA